MKILRTSCFTHPHRPPTIAIVAEDGIDGSIEDLMESTKIPGMFVTHQMFEMEGTPTPPELTFEANRRLTDDLKLQEQNQAVMYFYIAQQFPMLRAGAVISGDRPVPFSRERVMEVFRQLAKREDYGGFRFVYPLRSGEVVEFPS